MEVYIAKHLPKSLGAVCRFGCIYRRKSWIICKAIFEHGEIKFRKMEHEAFVELLNSGDYWSCGGTHYANNHELLNGRKMSVYLKASIETLFNRL
jgi:shikimate kinase